MSYEHKEGSGTLFVNRKKEKQTHPDWKGEIMINGVVLNLAAWTKLTKNGDEWLSVSVSEKQERQDQQSRERPASKFDKLADDIPFMRIGKYE